MPNLWENDHRTLHVVLLDGASTTVTISLVYKRSIFSSKCEPEAHKRRAYHNNSQSRHNKILRSVPPVSPGRLLNASLFCGVKTRKQGRSQKVDFFLLLEEANHINLYKNLIKI